MLRNFPRNVRSLIQGRKIHPKKSTQNKKVHLNKFFWTISIAFLTRVTGTKAKVRANFPKKFEWRRRFFGILGFRVGFWTSIYFVGAKKFRNKNSAQRGSFWPDIPADIRPKTSVRPSKSWKNKHFGTDIPRGRPRKNFGLKNFGLIFRSLKTLQNTFLEPSRCLGVHLWKPFLGTYSWLFEPISGWLFGILGFRVGFWTSIYFVGPKKSRKFSRKLSLQKIEKISRRASAAAQGEHSWLWDSNLGCTPRGSCNRTLLRRFLRRFSSRKCFLEGFLEGACMGFQ